MKENINGKRNNYKHCLAVAWVKINAPNVWKKICEAAERKFPLEFPRPHMNRVDVKVLKSLPNKPVRP